MTVNAFKDVMHVGDAMKLVVKYDGASISNASKIRHAVTMVSELARSRGTAQTRRNNVIVVCSAIGNTTDSLIDLIATAKKRNKTDTKKRAESIAAAHKKIVHGVITDERARNALLSALDADFDELARLADGISHLGDLTQRSLDYMISFGERLSTKIFAHALATTGTVAEALTGSEVGILTDSNFGEARPLMDTTRLRVTKTLKPHLAKQTVPVIGGFAGADQHGYTTTLGRSGSDYTATIIAACIDADEVWMINDVGGLMSADPQIVKNAAPVSSISYVEAMEMSTFGARQMHPKTFEPLLATKVPMIIARIAETSSSSKTTRSSHSNYIDYKTATRVGASSAKTIKCASTLRHNALIDIRGGSMVGEPGTAARIFGTLADAQINIMMISQNPSESSITIVVKKADLDRAIHTLEINLLGGIIKHIESVPNVAIVALIGSGMKGAIGVASRALGAVSKKRTNILMITQGSSELNLAFVVKESDSKTAVLALHSEFALGRRSKSKQRKLNRAR